LQHKSLSNKSFLVVPKRPRLRSRTKRPKERGKIRNGF